MGHKGRPQGSPPLRITTRVPTTGERRFKRYRDLAGNIHQATNSELLASTKGRTMSEAQDTALPVTAKEAKEDGGKRRADVKVSLPRVLTLLRPYRWQLVAAAILLVITNGLGLLYPLVIRSLLNTILSKHNAGLLNLVVVFLLVVFVLQAIFGALQGYLITSFGERFSFDLRTT